MNLEPTLLDTVALVLALVHFTIPVGYYFYLRKKYLDRPWGLSTDQNFQPKVTIIVPTFNEARLIKDKLDNIYGQDYPKGRLEIIVIDSASTDETPGKVREWMKEHPELNIRLIEEPVRRGMVPALNYALKYVSTDSELVIFTDVDAFWEQDTLKRAVSYFTDLSVGAVTTCIAPLQKDTIEKTYRNYYNVLRVAESKIHSTPIHNGVFIAYRKELLNKIGGLPTYTGNNDSTPASLIAFMGYRAIQADDTIAREPTRKGEVMRKIRRAQHLVLHFMNTRRYAKKLDIYRKTPFDKIWNIEAYLHLVNPWLMLIAIGLFIASALSSDLLAILILLVGVISFLFKAFRTWMVSQLWLWIAMFRCIKTKDIMWSK